MPESTTIAELVAVLKTRAQTERGVCLASHLKWPVEAWEMLTAARLRFSANGKQMIVPREVYDAAVRLRRAK